MELLDETTIKYTETGGTYEFELAGVPTRPFKHLDTPIFIIAHVPCTCACNTHAHCDVIRFAYDANHVTMTSPEFAFHSCHVETRWYDVISVRVVGTPRPHGSHRMGMM